ncbi:MAG TPA: pilus assembly protein N-terminal domain-containing protein [Propylenella sp.]|nr:pilus assembly protein N-terminal domain-containing protein [Propylenella sp.]
MAFQLGKHTRKLIGAALLGLAAAAANSGASLASSLDLTIDFATILKLERPAATLIIGNPGIADASVQDEKTVILTGKTAGSTNLIVLDDKGEEVANLTVRVSSDIRQLTTVFYGSKRQTFSCAPTCEQVISVGDNPDAFETAKTQIENRTLFATGK